jgi:UDP-N-acetylmuramyl pentapeptide phosphotransferase/UDP-N-acetylglucosamine-1-phosphate transferase
MGIQEIPMWLTYISTIFLMIVIINAVNLSDGIDGLAASIGIVASVTFGVCFFLSGNKAYTIMAAALTGTLVAFLRYNLSKLKKKIFMGDTGSLIKGFLIAAMTIRFNEVHATASAYYELDSAPEISFAILIVPLFDTLRVFTIRIMRGHHPFIADNWHIHHLMLRTGNSHKRSSFIISIVHIFIIILAFSLDHIGILWLALILLMVCLLLTAVIYLLVYKRYLMKHRSLNHDDLGTLRIILQIHRFFRPGKTVSVPVRAALPAIPKFVMNAQ